MSGEKPATRRDWANGLGLIAAVICSFLGFDHGGWPGAGVAAVVAFGGVHLAFAAIALAWRIIVAGFVLLFILAALRNRWDWLVGLAQ